jgi:hypothetical protein
MTAMRRQEGPRAPLFYAVPLLWCCTVSNAQSVDLARLEACNALPSDEARLACFEAIVSPAGDGAEPPAEVVAAPAAAPEPEPVAQPVPEPAAAPVVDTAPASDPASDTAAPATTGSVAAPAEPAAAPVAEPAPAAAVAEPATTPRDDDFGREHIESAPADEPYELRAVVTETVRRRDKGVTFTLDNGQVWQQVDDRYFPYPKDEDFAIVISQGMMGDYRLRVGGEGRMIRVRRTK